MQIEIERLTIFLSQKFVFFLHERKSSVIQIHTCFVQRDKADKNVQERENS